jgi:signal transduction histidine kinase
VVADGLGGERILAAHAPIAPQGWLVFVERPAAAAYAPLRAPIIRSVVIFVLGLGLSILASILLARRMVAPIRVLQEGAARIGAGDLAHRIEIRTGDELQTLGDELNRTASRLEESYTGLERKVAERTRDLTEALQRLTALSEVGRAVSSTLDLQTVLNSIVVHAGPLAGADGCAIYEYEEATQEFHLRATHNYDPALVAAITASPLRRGEGVMGRAAERGEPIQVPDITQPGAYETRQRDVLVRAGFRALLSVPLLFEDRIIGSLSVNRKAPGEYTSDVIEVLKTFATQSVLSLENARLFREIADQSRELEIASQHKSEFLANMSHELRTPLNAIIGFSEVLLERMFGEMNDKQTEYLQDIMGSGRHLLSLINDILDLSKVEAGRMELEPSEFHLPTALDDACTLVRERASRRNIALRVTVDERIGEVRADERKIKQVMLNLLSNAVKFTPEGGRIEVRAVPSNGFSEVSVSDTGVGIAPEDQAVVFDEFRQVGTSAAKREGTGLGLALSRKFIELHGGKIWVESQVGVGSTFTFTIPTGA